jgi:hypothetical protein
MPAWEIEFYEDERGDQPVRRWLRDELSPRKRRALGAAMRQVLQVVGVGVCGTEFGKQLGKGLFEFRLPPKRRWCSGSSATLTARS